MLTGSWLYYRFLSTKKQLVDAESKLDNIENLTNWDRASLSAQWDEQRKAQASKTAKEKAESEAGVITSLYAKLKKLDRRRMD